jgi:hypothetical protein
MPECIKYAVRRQCTEAVTAVQVKVKSESVAGVGVKGV